MQYKFNAKVLKCTNSNDDAWSFFLSTPSYKTIIIYKEIALTLSTWIKMLFKMPYNVAVLCFGQRALQKKTVLSLN